MITALRRRALVSLLALVALACSCAKRGGPAAGEAIGVSTVQSGTIELDPLASWNAGPTKQAVIDFVASVSTGGNVSFVPEQDRIAVFDNDGTLWPEKPLPEAAFTVARLKKEVSDDPKLAEREPYRSILASDLDKLSELGTEIILQALARTHSGMTDEAFEISVHTFLVDARHPVFGVPYPALAYRPMRELLAYLRDHKFTIYLCARGDQAFLRAFAPGTYGIPRERIIGSSFGKRLAVEDSRAELRRTPELESFNDREEKPGNIERYVGRRPIFAAGNVRAGGDIAMLTYTRTRPGPSFALVVHHDDPKREFAYDEPDGATLAAARERGFVVVSMKDDWSQVFDAAPVRRPAP